jgi:hypothetical protein
VSGLFIGNNLLGFSKKILSLVAELRRPICTQMGVVNLMTTSFCMHRDSEKGQNTDHYYVRQKKCVGIICHQKRKWLNTTHIR